MAAAEAAEPEPPTTPMALPGPFLSVRLGERAAAGPVGPSGPPAVDTLLVPRLLHVQLGVSRPLPELARGGRGPEPAELAGAAAAA